MLVESKEKERKNLKERELWVEMLLARLQACSGNVLVTQFEGLTMPEFQELRARLRSLQAECHVVKNTLVRRAFENLGWKELITHLEGPTALVWAKTELISTAKAVVEFSKQHEHLRVKAGHMAGQVMGAQDVLTLAQLPPRPILLAQFLAHVQTPLVRLTWVLRAPLHSLLWALYALEKNKRREVPSSPLQAQSQRGPGQADLPAGQAG